MKKILFPLLLFGYLGSGSAFGQSQDFNPTSADYLWPTEASSYLTSTFAETRSAHFHAALDIKTWGQRGYEVYATRDGIVDRIAIGPRGYGKVVYLKHPDGSYSVYAHLLSFNKDLQQLADSIRFSEGYKFEIERFLAWKNIEVEQGEVVGYSGASGIGPPHLHFELRTPSHKPFNPLLTNLSVADNIDPQISGISIEPLSPESSIQGKNAIYTQRSWGQKKNYDFGTVSTSGPIGLGINAFDQSNRVNNSYAVYELSMSVDGREFFKSRVDSFSYRETDQMRIDRVYPILQDSDKGYQRLYVTDGNGLPFYSTSVNKGILNLDPGLHTVTIRATDYYGNSTTATLQLDVQETDVRHPDLSRRSAPNLPISPPRKWHWFRNWVTLSNRQFSQTTIATVDSSKFVQHDNGVAINLKETGNLFMNNPRMGPVDFHRVDPNSVNIIPSGDYQHFALIPQSTVYDTVSVGMSVQKYHDNSIAVHMIPDVFPIRSEYKFYIQRDSLQADTTKRSFYKFDREDKEWDLIPTKFEKNYIVATAESLGKFSLQRDTTAPKLFNARLSQRPDGKWLVMVDVTDNLSGIDYSKTIMTANGVRGIAEFEPEDDRLVYYHPDFEPSPAMKIKVTAFDKMGNKQVASFELEQNQTKK